MNFDAPPLTTDAPTARQWVREELSKREYHVQKPLLERILDWLADHLGGTSVGGLSIPWWVPALVVVGILLVLGVLAGRRYSGNFSRAENAGNSVTATSLEIDTSQGAAHYRALAEQALDTDPDAALLAAYRAAAARAHENALVELTPATTVGDINEQLERSCPHLVASAQRAGLSFAGVRYGHEHASRTSVEKVLRLDDEIRETGFPSRAPRAATASRRTR